VGWEIAGAAVWRASGIVAAGSRSMVLDMARKRPCSICGCWFQPDARVGDRQHVCSKAECQAQRRRRKQARWRRCNPDYFVARRWTAATVAKEARAPRAPPPLEKVPCDVVQSQMGRQPGVILGLFGRVLLLGVQSQLRHQVCVITGESQTHPARRAQSQMEVRAGSEQLGTRDATGGSHP
jgi:hypothetical protein